MRPVPHDRRRASFSHAPRRLRPNRSSVGMGITPRCSNYPIAGRTSDETFKEPDSERVSLAHLVNPLNFGVVLRTMGLVPATTIIGYSSMLFSRNGALFSFGLLSVAGEIACLFAVLIGLLAMLAFRRCGGGGCGLVGGRALSERGSYRRHPLVDFRKKAFRGT
jgi:hypothetical protein